jgi:hypothetical protein
MTVIVADEQRSPCYNIIGVIIEFSQKRHFQSGKNAFLLIQQSRPKKSNELGTTNNKKAH